VIGLWALLLAPVSATAGLYQARQMEIGAALELGADGRFRYQLDYGAVSEHAEGRWTSDGKIVRLTTVPAPIKPSLELVRDEAAPPGEVDIKIESPGFGDGFRLEAVGTDALTGESGLVSVDSDGRVDSGGRRLSAIDPLVPVYGAVAGHFTLDPSRGHRLFLRFHANDLGTAAFEGEPLALADGALVLKRYDTEIRFLRTRP
jgi:hypothetical protein